MRLRHLILALMFTCLAFTAQAQGSLAQGDAAPRSQAGTATRYIYLPVVFSYGGGVPTPFPTATPTATSTATATSTPTPSSTPTVTPTLTPTVTPSPTATPDGAGGIYGRVTLRGQPASGVYLMLRLFNGVAYVDQGQPVRTDANGNYLFANAPALRSNQSYYVLFANGQNGNLPATDRLSWWGSFDIYSHADGQRQSGGDFDIADVLLTEPTNGASVRLPYTFAWQVRPCCLNDDYEFNLYRYPEYNPWYYRSMGYLGSFRLNSLPGGFANGAPYQWSLWIYNGGGSGESLYAYDVTFVAAAQARLEAVARPVLNSYSSERLAGRTRLR